MFEAMFTKISYAFPYASTKKSPNFLEKVTLDFKNVEEVRYREKLGPFSNFILLLRFLLLVHVKTVQRYIRQLVYPWSVRYIFKNY